MSVSRRLSLPTGLSAYWHCSAQPERSGHDRIAASGSLAVTRKRFGSVRDHAPLQSAEHLDQAKWAVPPPRTIQREVDQLLAHLPAAIRYFSARATSDSWSPERGAWRRAITSFRLVRQVLVMRWVIFLVVERPELLGPLPFLLLKGVTLYQPSRFAPVVGTAPSNASRRSSGSGSKKLSGTTKSGSVPIGRGSRRLWQRANLGDGDVAPAEDHGLATFNAVEVLRETRLGIGEVHFDHVVRL